MIQLLSRKARLNVPTTAVEAQKFIARRTADTPENSVLSAAYIAGSDTFKAEKESLPREIDKLKRKHSSRQSRESDA